MAKPTVSIGDPNEQERNKKAAKRLKRLIGEIQDLIDDDKYTYFLSITEDKSKLTIHTGNGCPVCSVSECMKWIIEQKIHHTTGEPAFVHLGNLEEIFGNDEDEKLH